MSGAQRSSCCKKNIRRGKCVWCGNHTTGYIPLGSAKSTASPSPGGGGLFGIFSGKQRLDAAQQPQSRAVPGEWTADDDKRLWNGRDGSLTSLAQQLGRGAGGVSSRLVHLRDPTHKAYQRLHGTARAASAPAAPLDTAKLNAMQLRAVELAQQGASFFLTGGAGTGKSFTLDFVVRALQRMHGAQNVFVAASTGIAACHIGGTTLHSFAGVGLAQASELPPSLSGCNRTCPGCNPVHPACNPVHPGCNPVHPGCNPVYPRSRSASWRVACTTTAWRVGGGARAARWWWTRCPC
jgi:hypothetical protein